MKKLLIIVVVLCLLGGGAYFYLNKNKAPEILTAQDVLSYFFEQEYNGYSEGTITVKDAESELQVRVQADPQTRYYYGTTVSGDETTSLKKWFEDVSNTKTLVYTHDALSNKWTETVSEEKNGFISVSALSFDEVFANVTMEEDESNYTLKGTGLYQDLKEYFSLPKDQVFNTSLCRVFGNQDTVSYTMVLNKNTYTLTSLLMESTERGVSFAIVPAKFNEDTILDLPKDLTDNEDSHETIKTEGKTSLPGDVIEYIPVAGLFLLIGLTWSFVLVVRYISWEKNLNRC